MSSYIRLEILLFFRAFETGVGMLVVYRLTDMLKRRLFCDRMWNSTVDILYWLLAGLLLFTALYQCNYGRIRFFMLAGVAFGGIFANFVLNIDIRKDVYGVIEGADALKKSKKKKNKKRIANNYLGMAAIAIVVLLLLGGLTYQSQTLKARIAVYDAKASALEDSIAGEQERTQEIDEQKEYMQTDEYIAEVARDKLGLVKGNEIVFEEEK